MMARAFSGMRTPAASNPAPGGVAGGTMGGTPRSNGGGRPGMPVLNIGDEMYLWILVILEVVLMGWLRQHFRRHHGG